jgi:hypothetical protein
VILDTEGNIFGGFTPVEWESRVWNGKRDWEWKADDSQKSFLFTLKNPENIPARRFALKAEKKHRAIHCDSKWGPGFGGGCDISVHDSCHANTLSFTSPGSAYTNDTGLDDKIVLTGSHKNSFPNTTSRRHLSKAPLSLFREMKTQNKQKKKKKKKRRLEIGEGIPLPFPDALN